MGDAAEGGEVHDQPQLTQLPAELVKRVAASLAALAPNDVPCNLRLVCKDIGALLRGPEHTTVRLSRPVPPAAFHERWTRPDATHPLTLSQRNKLLRLTAASGVVPNLEVAVRASGLRLEQDTVGGEMLCAAAKAGQLPSCQWLRQQGLGWGAWKVLAEAARGGHLELCKALRAGGSQLCEHTVALAAASGDPLLVAWLLEEGYDWDAHVAGTAARGGHLALMALMMQLHNRMPAQLRLDYSGLLQGAAWGCDLPTFTRVYAWCAAHGYDGTQSTREWEGTAADGPSYVLMEAVASPTPDWADKAAWLLDAKGYPPSLDGLLLSNVADAMGRPDASARLAWMRQRGLVTSSVLQDAMGVLREGSAVILPELLELGATPRVQDVSHAAFKGHLPVLQLLHAHGVPLKVDGEDYNVFDSAVSGGRVAVLDWLEATRFPEGLPPPGTFPLTQRTFAAACRSESAPVMRWLAARGCPCEAACWDVMGCASVEAVEFLVEHGCPFGADGKAYLAAGWHENYPVLDALRRLGCPWSAAVLTDAVEERVSPHVLRWMVQQGCPVDPAAAVAAAEAALERAQEVDSQDYMYDYEPNDDAEAQEVLKLMKELALGAGPPGAEAAAEPAEAVAAAEPQAQ